MKNTELDIRELRNDLRKCISEQVTIADEVMDNILSRFHPQILQPGENFIEPNRICRKLAYIQKGVLRLYNYADGQEITLWLANKNRFITDLSSFIHQRSARWRIEAVAPSILLTITREEHYKLIDKYREWIEFDNLLLTNAYTIIEERMFSHLYMSADKRFKKLFEEEPELFNKVPLKQIASMLAMAPETLSRMRSKHSD
ncbi:MAG: cyclic nucleotide-binding domain-containing protein [Bacteroidetes bacterium]|jgi:signal-transduction protein with cAMP-binding, CBS, and nucleotidyltransferase domain|nr:cyclic nucleotide-binding domain-containing protein [Bacteroidota bacterium]